MTILENGEQWKQDFQQGWLKKIVQRPIISRWYLSVSPLSVFLLPVVMYCMQKEISTRPREKEKR